jgi:hypothetical protein
MKNQSTEDTRQNEMHCNDGRMEKREYRRQETQEDCKKKEDGMMGGGRKGGGFKETRNLDRSHLDQ